ncbi:hypothetical protein [Neisseria meningitidis]|nr:hypothetical protein [Neisseria meningitidis]
MKMNLATLIIGWVVCMFFFFSQSSILSAKNEIRKRLRPDEASQEVVLF